MKNESQTVEYKSIRKIRAGDNGFKELSVTCVCLANARGGTIFIGIEDKSKQPPVGQTVQTSEANDAITKLRSLCYNVALSASEILVHENGGQYFDIEKKAIELTYFYELPDGLYRKQIRHYHPKLIRELLLNAFAHQSFTISGDIMLKVYPDRLEISNPGGLPIGVTKDNILHACQRRNPYFLRVMHDLKLMEGEGSGYDLIYQLDAMDAKELPQISSDFNTTTIIQTSKIVNEEILPLLDYVTKNYDISQKNIIALGLIAQHQKLLSTELCTFLQLDDNKRLRSYVDKLVELGIVDTWGIKKGNSFLINPKVIANSKANIKTSLKTVEPHRLVALIEEDLRLHPNSMRREIHKRLPDIDEKDLQKYLYEMVKSGKINYEGGKTFRQYYLVLDV